jgi:hypothetical protein
MSKILNNITVWLDIVVSWQNSVQGNPCLMLHRPYTVPNLSEEMSSNKVPNARSQVQQSKNAAGSETVICGHRMQV